MLDLVQGSKIMLEFSHFTSNSLSLNCVPNIALDIRNLMTQSCPVPALGIQIITQINYDFQNPYKEYDAMSYYRKPHLTLGNQKGSLEEVVVKLGAEG